MTQDSVTDKLWHAFMLAWEAAPDDEVVLQARFALNAIASRLRAEGMRELADKHCYNLAMNAPKLILQKDIYPIADALDTPPQKDPKP